MLCRKTLETQDLKILICSETLKTQDLKILIVPRPWKPRTLKFGYVAKPWKPRTQNLKLFFFVFRRFFADSEETAARSAAKFAIAVQPTI